MAVVALKNSEAFTLSIERGVPMYTPAAFYDRIPWDTIKVGDSFAVTEAIFGENAVQRLRTAIQQRQKIAAGQRYTVRKSRDGSHRCWRTQ